VKRISIAIDEETLSAIDALLADQAGPWRSRSQLIREAVRQFLREAERRCQEAHEAAVFCKHREELAAQARALIAEQAEP
jgi:metal-responsive CopG/Arc/MetJ family transcriptional regulator